MESDENPSDTSCADAECSVVDDHEHKKTNSDGSSLWPSADILAWKEVVVRTHFTEKETIEEKFSRLLEGDQKNDEIVPGRVYYIHTNLNRHPVSKHRIVRTICI